MRRDHVADEHAGRARGLEHNGLTLDDRGHPLATLAARELAFGEPALIAREVRTVLEHVGVLPRLVRPPPVTLDDRLARASLAVTEHLRVLLVLAEQPARRLVGHL